MEWKAHLITSSILTAILYPFVGLNAAFALIGGFAIDIDHYFWYVYKFRIFSVGKCFKYFKGVSQRNDVTESKKIFLAFHTIEAVVALIILSFFQQILFIILLGLLLHFVLDIIYRVSNLKTVFATPPSVIACIFK